MTRNGEFFEVPMTLWEMEKRLLEKTLEYHDGNRTKAAKSLGISRRTITTMIDRHYLPKNPPPHRINALVED